MVEVAFPRKIAFAFYSILFLAGVIFYLVWGIRHGSWNLLRPEWVGVYAVTIVLVAFGIVGMLLYKD